MLLYVFSFLLAIGISKCETSEEPCDNSQVMTCMEPLLNLDLEQLDDADSSEFCAKAQMTVDCFREFATRCLPPGEGIEGFHEAIEDLENKLSSVCEDQTSEEDELSEMDENEILKCFEHVETDMAECVEEVVPQVIAMFQDQEPDENKIKCLTFSLMAECATERIEKRCGSHMASAFGESLEASKPGTMFEGCGAETVVSVVNLLDV